MMTKKIHLPSSCEYDVDELKNNAGEENIKTQLLYNEVLEEG